MSGVLEIRRANEFRECPLNQPVITIGRGADNQVVLDDELISRHHAKLEQVKSSLYITDLGSSNGTTVNSVKIQPVAQFALKEGAVISIGSFKLTVRLLPATNKIPPSMFQVVEEGTAAPAEKAPPPARERAAVYTEARATAPPQGGKSKRGTLWALIIGIITLAVIIALSVTLVCSATVAKADIIAEFIESLKQISEAATGQIEAEVDSIDQELFNTDEKLLKLEQVITPALEWVERQKDKARTQGASFVSQVNAEGLDKLKNDQYQVTTLEGKGNTSGQFTPIIRVTDLTTNTTRDWEKFDSELKFLRSTLKEQRQERLAAGILSAQTLLEIINYWEDWDIKKLNETTYSISGPHLGLADGPAKGKWTYYKHTGESKPTDNESAALKKLLAAES